MAWHSISSKLVLLVARVGQFCCIQSTSIESSHLLIMDRIVYPQVVFHLLQPREQFCILWSFVSISINTGADQVSNFLGWDLLMGNLSGKYSSSSSLPILSSSALPSPKSARLSSLVPVRDVLLW